MPAAGCGSRRESRRRRIIDRYRLAGAPLAIDARGSLRGGTGKSLNFTYMGAPAMSADTTLMPIPGPIDPVPVPRAAIPRADGQVELVGLPKDAIRAALEEAGLEPQAGQAARQADLALDL